MNTNWAGLGKTAISFNEGNACLRVAPDGDPMINTRVTNKKHHCDKFLLTKKPRVAEIMTVSV